MEHVTDNEFAELAAASCTGAPRRRLMDHIAKCQECRDTLALAMRAETGQKMFAGHVPQTEDLVRLGMSSTLDAETTTRKNHKIMASSLVAAAAIATVLFLLMPRGETPYPLPKAQDIAIHTAMVDLSSRGYIVLPTTEETITPTPSATRSGPGTQIELPKSMLTPDDKENADRVFWEVGRLISAGGYLAAVSIASEALRFSPESRGLQHLRAIALFYDGQLDSAIVSLERIVDEHPEDATALINVAVMLQEAGRTSDSQMALDRASQQTDSAPLKERAHWLLSTFSN